MSVYSAGSVQGTEGPGQRWPGAVRAQGFAPETGGSTEPAPRKLVLTGEEWTQEGGSF